MNEQLLDMLYDKSISFKTLTLGSNLRDIQHHYTILPKETFHNKIQSDTSVSHL
jgi:hypothetical protein